MTDEGVDLFVTRALARHDWTASRATLRRLANLAVSSEWLTGSHEKIRYGM